MQRVIIAGGRDFDNFSFLGEEVGALLDYELTALIVGRGVLEIVSGAARGADKLGEKWAQDNGVPVKSFPADWYKLGKRAGILRNVQMAEYADGLIAFWDGGSVGTRHMIKAALEKGLEVHVYRYENNDSKQGQADSSGHTGLADSVRAPRCTRVR